jgi:hypothetical protein
LIFRKTLVAAAACILTGCKQPSAQHTVKPITTSQPQVDTMITGAPPVQSEPMVSWQPFERYNGLYAIDADLLQREPLHSRITALLGKDMGAFMQRLDVTPPVELENKILYTQGCHKQHCGKDEAALAVDMDRDVIYVGIARDGVVQLYSERGDRTFPEKILRWKEKF